MCLALFFAVLSTGLACKKPPPLQTPVDAEEKPGVTVGHLVGNRAPEFSLKQRDGKVVNLRDLRGKVVFLNFWATWCAPCRNEMPAMEVLHRKMKDRNFAMLAISGDQDGWASVEPFVSRLGLTFPILLDSEQKAAISYRAFRFPETFVINAEGIIIDKRLGAAPWEHPKFVGYFEKLTKPL